MERNASTFEIRQSLYNYLAPTTETPHLSVTQFPLCKTEAVADASAVVELSEHIYKSPGNKCVSLPILQEGTEPGAGR